MRECEFVQGRSRFIPLRTLKITHPGTRIASFESRTERHGDVFITFTTTLSLKSAYASQYPVLALLRVWLRYVELPET